MDKFKYIVVVRSPHTYAQDWTTWHRSYEDALALAKEYAIGTPGNGDYREVTIARITEVFEGET